MARAKIQQPLFVPWGLPLARGAFPCKMCLCKACLSAIRWVVVGKGAAQEGHCCTYDRQWCFLICLQQFVIFFVLWMTVDHCYPK